MIHIICIALAFTSVALGVTALQYTKDLEDAEKRIEELDERIDYLVKELLK